MTWLYNEQTLSEDLIPTKAVGFVYLITDLETNKKYIGRKLLYSAAYKMVNGKKKKIKKDSDWRDYYSSSPYINQLISESSKERFKREILVFCENKLQMMYLEEKFQYIFGVLESDEFLNSNIRAKIMKKHIIGKIDASSVNSAIQLVTERLNRP